jgi:murein L,D-transpeptidase YcbB/YkuD
MLLGRLLALALSACLVDGAASASEQVGPTEGAAATPEVVLPAGSLPSPMPPQPLAAELLPPGFTLEFMRRLSTESRMTAAERADRAALQQFYQDRLNEPVWVGADGYGPAAEAALAEIGRADDWGLEASAFELPVLVKGAGLARDQQADAETALSLAVLQYARHARGGRTDPPRLSRNLDRRPQLLDPHDVIVAATSTDRPDAYLRSLHPQHPQFERLRQQYLALKHNQPAVAETVAEPKGKSKRQKRKAKTPARPSLRTLLVNMEQWRWMPSDLGGFHVWANIPEYTVRIVKNGRVVHDERMVVGRTSTQTPVFSDEMEQVIFHPYWGVPESIKKNELMPSLARGNTGILERHNLRISYRGRNVDPDTVDWTRVDLRKFHVYQPPGNGNVLGVVKFRFPNKHDVYMHDTPSRRLFNASVRTFSHGCMRIRDPLKLAEIVLAEDRGWSASRVVAAVRRGPKDNQINLETKVPVHMTYFTAWVEDDGRLRVYDDVYGHEKRIAMALAGKAPVIQREPTPMLEAKPKARTRTVSNTRASTGRRASRDWMRAVFQY